MPGVTIFNVYEDFIKIVATVTKNHAARKRYMGQYINRHCVVVDISGGQLQVYRVTQRINYRMNLRVFAATAYAYVLFRPFFPPAACWCTLIELESILRFS